MFVGAGEYIVRTMLAHAVGDSINACILGGSDVDPHEILCRVLVEKFWGEYVYSCVLGSCG